MIDTNRNMRQRAETEITLVPEGGLGNRMNAIAAAVQLAEEIDAKLDVVWFQDWGMGCGFDDLFKPIEKKNVRVRNASFLDKIMYDRPRRKNLFVPKPFEWLLFDRCIGSVEICRAKLDFMSACRDKKTWMAAYCYFLSKERPKEAFKIFMPKGELQEKINHIATMFRRPTIGVHIRRSDNILSIKESPTSLFIERMKQEDDTKLFYLATDSDEEKVALRKAFGNRIITSDSKADRGSVEGMQNAVTELFLLAKTSLIIGSFYSSFSETASLLGDVKLEIIKRNNV